MPERKDRDKGDRRQLTVLFCDVAGSAQILETLNEEDWSYVLREYHESCQQIIEHYDGHIAQYLGDGLLAYFGYPLAHENNPHRAIKAALEIIAQIEAINERICAAIGPGRATLKLRVAVHTGLVVVDELGGSASAERIALGIVPTIAARLQAEAEDNSIIISDSTFQLVRGTFDCTHLGSLSLKGISTRQVAYKVNRETELQSRFEVEVNKGLTPFVGREEELAVLIRSWDEASKGKGRVVLVDGDPGIGKSRLVQEFTDRLDDDKCRRLLCSCSSYNRNSAHFPVIQLIHALLGVKVTDGDDLKLERFEETIARINADPNEMVPIVGRLLSMQKLSRYEEPKISPLHEKQKLHELLIAWLRAESELMPIRLFIEDLQWVDPSSHELLDRLIASIADSHLLVIVAFRPECVVDWQDFPHVERLTLGSLLEHEAETMVRHLQRGHELSPDVVERLIANTDGVPLFLEESAILLLANESVDYRTVPPSLHDLLMARLDRLGSAKPLAQLAATIGHEFSYSLLRAVTGTDDGMLRSQLEQLVATGLVYSRGDLDVALYCFKHALVRDTAYSSLLSRPRKQVHRRIAEVLCESFPDSARNQPELVAHHYTEAGLVQLAVDYWQKAGLRSTERYELREAVRHLRKALGLIETMPRNETRIRQELDVLAMLAGRLIATEGYGAAGVETMYTRALDLARELSDTPRSMQMMLGLESFHFMRSNFQMAHRLADQCLVLARQLGDPARQLIIHWVLGEIFFHQGDYALCGAHLNECINDYKQSFHRPRTLQDPAVMSLSYRSWVHWKLGFPERALQSITQAIELAEALRHPFSRSVAYSFAAGLHLFRGETELTREYAGRAIDVCTEHGFPVWLAFCTVVSGRARVSHGEFEAGIQDMETGIRTWESLGAIVTTPYCYSLLAEGLAIAGQPELGLKRLEHAQLIVDRTGERYYESEINRLRGELQLQANGNSESRLSAESYYYRAIDISRRQGARSLELRALISLARLTLPHRIDDALRSRLNDTYQGFTEGTATADLMEARRILAIGT